MGVVFLVFGFAAGLIFPVFVSLDFFTDAAENKFCFSLSLYKFFKVFGGYLQFDREGICIHVSEKKAIFLPYKEMAPMRQKFEITKGFQLYKFHQIVETGGEGKPLGLMIASLFQIVGGQVFSVLKTRHPFLSLKSGVLLCENARLKVSLQTVTIFNGLILIIAIAKKILEAILKWSRKKRSIALWKRRQSA